MREIEVPPLLYARGLLTILQQSAGCWAPKNLQEAEVDFFAAVAFFQNWRLLYKKNIARNVALTGGELIGGGDMADGSVCVRLADGTEGGFAVPATTPVPWQMYVKQTPASFLAAILGNMYPLMPYPAFLAEQQAPSPWANPT
ncbi:MAG: hypothetical protein LBJ38_02235 [Oscillospiraceae bacterium]|nr:hypothetical protein [Oscillospiraceae bacterium]